MVYVLCIIGLTASWAWGQAGAAAAVAELERRLNSRLVDAVVGEVDYDLTYYRKGTHAYALENVRRFQQQGKMRWDDAAQTLIIRQEAASDTAESAVLSLGPAGDSKEILRAAQNPRRAERATTQGKALSDSAVAVAELLSAAAVRPSRSAHTRPFERDSTRTFGGRGARLRHYGDWRGDIASFDLDGVSVAQLQRREKPAHLRHMEGLRLGVTLARPTRKGMAKLTRIEEEHRLGRRRLMRLELRELYAAIPADALLDLDIKELKENGRQGRAVVEWSYSDAPARRRRATLRLRRSEEGWQIDQAWDFIADLGAVRRQIEAAKAER